MFAPTILKQARLASDQPFGAVLVNLRKQSLLREKGVGKLRFADSRNFTRQDGIWNITHLDFSAKSKQTFKTNPPRQRIKLREAQEHATA